MNTDQINRLLVKNPQTRNSYIGCFAADCIPTSMDFYPHCMCVNSAPASDVGEHWLAIYSHTPQKLDYFDSLGKWPPTSEHLQRFIGLYPDVQYSKVAVQNPLSAACGLHACYFLLQLCRGRNFLQILHELCDKWPNADQFVARYMRKHIFSANALG